MPSTDPNPGAQRLVQSRLTAAFFSPKVTNHASPYFTKPPPAPASSPTPDEEPSSITTISSKTSSLDLHPARRSKIFRSPPRLPTSPSSSTQRMLLAATAAETKSLLPRLLASTPHAPATGQLLQSLPPLDRKYCPRLPPSRIRVLNTDTLDAALALALSLSTSPSPPSSSNKTTTPPVLILNMANAQHAGGGWLRGALAQEESLCYRSSLSFTLKNRFYPLPAGGGIYSPSVLVMRENLARGHNVLDLAAPNSLPVVSVVSVAAVQDPALTPDGERYARAQDREAMKARMRVVLRIAGRKGHRTLVLGALGCGAFGNPRKEVVRCWMEVLGEGEFAGGWWERVVFAVMEEGGEEDGEGNFGTFWRGLDGVGV